MRRRKWEVQVQGRFLKAPVGPVYMGAELERPMSLGILTRSLSRLVLGVLRNVTVGLHASFGDTKSDPEAPGISFPIVKMADIFIGIEV